MKPSNFKLICIGIIATFFLTANAQAQTKTPPVKTTTEKNVEKKKEKKEKKAKKKAKKHAKKVAKQKAAKQKATAASKN